MLVYCSTIFLNADTDINTIYQIMADWLSWKEKQEILPSDLYVSSDQILSEGGQLEVFQGSDNFSALFAIRYSHADARVSGRRWISELGVRKKTANDEFECSIQLRIEVGIRSTTDIQTSVPFFARELIERCLPVKDTPGLDINVLKDVNDIRAFGHAIDFEERKHPYILVSPTPDDEYLVNLDVLRREVQGIADLVQIPSSLSTFIIGEVIGQQNVVWDGGINIIFPFASSKNKVPTRRYSPQELNELSGKGVKLEKEILSELAHRMNLIISWRHISPEFVRRSRRRNELEKIQEKANKQAGENSEWIQLLEQENKEIIKNETKLMEEFKSLEAELVHKDDENRQLNYQNQSLLFAMQNPAISSNIVGASISPEMREWLIKNIGGKFTPKQSLEMINQFYPDRLIILKEAWRSTEDSKLFRKREKLCIFLWKLADEYWLSLVNGKGDVQGRAIFGKNGFSAKESETVYNTHAARKKRIFQYEGKEVEMMRHLRIGVKDTPEKTIRVHFHWDAMAQHIVIGHCGPHLDFK